VLSKHRRSLYEKPKNATFKRYVSKENLIIQLGESKTRGRDKDNLKILAVIACKYSCKL
jgi:hypothetical protein